MEFIRILNEVSISVDTNGKEGLIACNPLVMLANQVGFLFLFLFILIDVNSVRLTYLLILSLSLIFQSSYIANNRNYIDKHQRVYDIPQIRSYSYITTGKYEPFSPPPVVATATISPNYRMEKEEIIIEHCKLIITNNASRNLATNKAGDSASDKSPHYTQVSFWFFVMLSVGKS